MPAIFNWCEDNGPATGSPTRGTTRSQISSPPTDVNWKAIDNAKTSSGGTDYSVSSIGAGTASFTKWQYGQFSGTFNTISNCKWTAHDSPAGAIGTGISLVGKVVSSYVTPSRTANAGISSPTNFTSDIPVASGLTVLFSTVGPEGASPTTTLTAPGFTQYLVTQLQTNSSAEAGDTVVVISALMYDEN